MLTDKSKTFKVSDDNPDIIELTREQINDIAASRNDIKLGSFIENHLLEKEVRIWLRER